MTTFYRLCVTVAALLIPLFVSAARANPQQSADAVVAADGSGDFTTIQAAIYAGPYRPTGPLWVIRIKPGTYLGRPWRKSAMTLFRECQMSEVVHATGWHNWGDRSRETTVRYFEDRNRGSGARPDSRVAWADELTTKEAERITLAMVLGGENGWDPRSERRATPANRSGGWGDLDTVLRRIIPPQFPDRDLLITDFGAVVGEDSTEAIQEAITSCHDAGGGRVIVPPGKWLTGALNLQSNVNLHLSDGATLEWIFDLNRYPLVFTRWEGIECMNFSPLIYAFEQENIAVTGKGTLDGGATDATWWQWKSNDPEIRRRAPLPQKKDRDALIAMGAAGVPVEERRFGKGHFLRPNFIQTYRCRNVLIEGVTIRRSPMWVIHPTLSQNVTVRDVSIISHGANSDGCNPESCRDVLIEDTLFDTGDDCIAIKSGRNNDGRRIDVPSENIIVRNCKMKDGHGGVVLGSECSGHIRNVWVEQCIMDSPNLDRALRFKNNAVRGGILENVFMRDIRIGRVAEAVLTIDLLYEEGPKGDHQAIVRNVNLLRVVSSASPRVMYIRGYDGAVIDDIHFRDCSFSGVSETEVVQHAGSITMKNVNISPE